jgi:signal transduction histidine kinase
MSSTFSHPSPLNLHPLVARLRLPLVLWALLVVLYYGIENNFGAPVASPIIEVNQNGIAKVIRVWPAAHLADSSGTTNINLGDVLVAIDGIPFRNSDLGFRFGPPAAFHSYTFQRGTERFIVIISSGPPTARDLAATLLPGLVAIETWVLGCLVLLFAPAADEVAWQVGLVTIGMAVAFAGAVAANSGVPASRLAYETLMPIMAVGYVDMAYLSGVSVRGQRRPSVFMFLYGIAVILALLAAIEIIWLNPLSSWQALTGIDLGHVRLAVLALALLATPGIMLFRLWRGTSPHVGRQTSVLLAGTGLAILPFVILRLVPAAFGISLPSAGLTLLLLGLIPASYGYVIYRHRYLNLDWFASRSLTLLAAALAVAVLYLTVSRTAARLPQLAPFEVILATAVFLAAFALFGRVSSRVQRSIDHLLYGPDRHFDEATRRFTAELSATPQFQTLRSVLLRDVPELLEIRQAALLLTDAAGLLSPVGMLRVAAVDCLEPATLAAHSRVFLRHADGDFPLFAVYPWAHLAAPLRMQAKVCGLLLLGSKFPDGFFDSQEVAFIQQLAVSAAATAENARLFEALNEMSQDLLRVRAAERMDLSYRLHDEPLQRAGAIRQQLDRVALAVATDSELASVIRDQQTELNRLAAELREICAGLRPPILDQGLRLTLKEIVESARVRMPTVAVKLSIDLNDEPDLASETLDAVYHIATEALNNVHKHAQAATVNVRLYERENRQVTLAIADDGSGSRLASLSLPHLIRSHHYGLVGMYQWAAVAHAELAMTAASPRGTTVSLTLPPSQTPAAGLNSIAA